MENSIHTFVVLAYKESPYLEEAIQSVLNQKYPSKVVIATSTPCPYIDDMAKKYGLDVIENPVKGSGSIGDFDFAWANGNNTIVTIAHQDDLYDPEYSMRIVEAYCLHPESVILFTDYYEIRDGVKVYKNRLLNIKKALLLPMRVLRSTKSIFWKQSPIRFGNGICCPSVAYVPKNIPFDKIFRQDVTNVEELCEDDWYGWYKLSTIEDTNFTYVPEALMGHRVHEDSHTSWEIQDKTRSRQELNMFKKLWPAPVAKFIEYFYEKGQASNG